MRTLFYALFFAFFLYKPALAEQVLQITMKPDADVQKCKASILKGVTLASELTFREARNEKRGAYLVIAAEFGNLQDIRKLACVDFANEGKYPEHYDRGIYFDSNDISDTFRNCYMGDFEETKTRLLQKDHKSLTTLYDVEVTTEGQNFKLSYQFSPNSEREPVSAILRKCVFEKYDPYKGDSCKVTVIDSERQHDEQHISVDKKWKALGSPIINCEDKTLTRVTNTWTQDMSLADIKIAKALSESGQKMITVGASYGFIKLGDSLNPFQHWSAEISLPFLKKVYAKEVCDASVLQFSVPGEAEDQINGPLQGSWCPWGVELLQIECNENGTIRSNVPERVPLEMTPSMTNYCSTL